MSNYTAMTKHPKTGEFKRATWIDDKFGSHNYGVQFEGETEVYDCRKIKLETRELTDQEETEFRERYAALTPNGPASPELVEKINKEFKSTHPDVQSMQTYVKPDWLDAHACGDNDGECICKCFVKGRTLGLEQAIDALDSMVIEKAGNAGHTVNQAIDLLKTLQNELHPPLSVCPRPYPCYDGNK